jgi:hypothetical protein
LKVPTQPSAQLRVTAPNWQLRTDNDAPDAGLLLTISIAPVLAHRRRRHAEHVCDLRSRELLQIAQHKRAAVEVRQASEGSGRPIRQGTAINHFVGMRGDL